MQAGMFADAFWTEAARLPSLRMHKAILGKHCRGEWVCLLLHILGTAVNARTAQREGRGASKEGASRLTDMGTGPRDIECFSHLLLPRESIYRSGWPQKKEDACLHVWVKAFQAHYAKGASPPLPPAPCPCTVMSDGCVESERQAP